MLVNNWKPGSKVSHERESVLTELKQDVEVGKTTRAHHDKLWNTHTYHQITINNQQFNSAEFKSNWSTGVSICYLGRYINTSPHRARGESTVHPSSHLQLYHSHWTEPSYCSLDCCFFFSLCAIEKYQQVFHFHESSQKISNRWLNQRRWRERFTSDQDPSCRN